MLNYLAQTPTYDYDYSRDLTTAESTGLLAFFGAYALIWLIIAAVSIAGLWKIFEKAGRTGWHALIPIYNYWILAEISGKPGWYALVTLLVWIPVLGPIAALIVAVLVSIGLAKAFKKDPVWAVFIIFLPFIALPMLGFGQDKYVGVKAEKTDKPAE